MPSWAQDPQRFTPRADNSGHLVLFLNGILTLPCDRFAWTDRAERWFSRNTRHDFDSVEYFQTPLLGRFREAAPLQEAHELLAGYFGSWKTPPQLHVVAHSRGCELARRLVAAGWPIRTLHLFAAAIDADFEKNGLNAALRSHQVGGVHLYTSPVDNVLRYLAGASLGLYGRLGFSGPKNIDPSARDRVHVLRRELTHSEWFAPLQFESAMRFVSGSISRARL